MHCWLSLPLGAVLYGDVSKPFPAVWLTDASLRQAGVGSCLVSDAELHEPSKRHWNYREGLSIFVRLEGVGDIICGAYGYKSRQDVKLVTRTPSLGQGPDWLLNRTSWQIPVRHECQVVPTLFRMKLSSETSIPAYNVGLVLILKRNGLRGIHNRLDNK